MKRKLILIFAGVLTLAAVFYLGRTSASETGEQGAKGTQAGKVPKASAGFEVKKASEPDGQAAADKKSEQQLSFEVEGPFDLEQMSEMSNHLAAAMKKRNERKVEKLIDRLVEELGLDEGQRAELEEYFAAQVALASGLMGGGEGAGDPMASMKALQALEGKNLGEMLADVLTPAQTELWEKSEKERTERVADSGALKNLAKLNEVLTLREEQRDAIYDHFYQKSIDRETETGARAGMGSMISTFTSELGVEVDASLFEGGMPDLSNATNTQERMAAMREHRDQQIEEQVEELAPLLDEEQQNDYREHLKSRGGILNGLFSVE